MISVDLVEFLRSGNFGGLRLGMTGQEVRTLLGEPEDTSVSNHPLIWKYGRFQIAFDENRIVSMTAYFERGRGKASKKICFKGWTPSARTSIETFVKRCAAEGMPCRTQPLWSYEDTVGFVLESGVSAYFDRKGKQSSLCGLSLMDTKYGTARAGLRVGEVQGVVDQVKKQVGDDKSKTPKT